MKKKDSLVSMKTIHDFGVQWTTFNTIEDWTISNELFSSITPPFVSKKNVKNKVIVEIGAGSGNMSLQILEANPQKLIVVEPSDAFGVLQRNLDKYKQKIVFIHDVGAVVSSLNPVDYIFSIGVIHHIPDPVPTIKAAFDALKPGGEILLWVYGNEGSELYLALIVPLRKVTKKLGHKPLSFLTYTMLPFIYGYMIACLILPLPLSKYIKNILWKMPAKGVRLVAYDQLNPEYTKYYTQKEAKKLLLNVGFIKVRAKNREGYSWTIYGRKPY